jgi:hypothetical protein
LGSSQPIVSSFRGHLDVGHHDVGAVRTGLAEQGDRIFGNRHNVDAGLVEDVDGALSDERLVLPTMSRNGSWPVTATRLRPPIAPTDRAPCLGAEPDRCNGRVGQRWP